jgi:hypothetical protein
MKSGWHVMKYTPHFVKGMVITGNMGERVCAHIFSKYLTRMTFLDRFDAIFKDRRPEITNVQNILGCFQP